ncbi:MAG: hypothetical protein IJ716_00485 [Lachnospiraceae bacterium]|nr:hypothetical protein [Lachnospiraceae bacterium]
MKKKQLTAIAMAGVLAAGVLSYGVSAQADGYSTDYTITIPATLNVADAGWNATSGITANNSTNNFDTGKKLAVTAESTNGWKLKSDGVSDTVGYNLATADGTYNENAAPALWEFSAAELNEASGTTKAMGIIVEDYSNKAAGNYSDTVTFTAKVESAQSTITWGCSQVDYYNFVSSGSGKYKDQNISVTGTGNSVNFWGDESKFGFNINDNDSLTFTSTDGKISQIVITSDEEQGVNVDNAGDLSSGWTVKGSTLTWSGTPSESVSLSIAGEQIMVYRISTIKFTVE